MVRRYGLAIAAVAACVTFPAAAQMQGGGGGDESHLVPSQSLPPDPEGKAEDLRLAGKCDEAIPILRRMVSYGDIYELSQYNLGLCLLDVAKTQAEPQRTASQQEAAVFMLKAANHNLPKAQASLVEMYLDGVGVARDPLQAGTWALIYRANGQRFALGLPNISDALQARLDAVLTDVTWEQARARANAWTPVAPKEQ